MGYLSNQPGINGATGPMGPIGYTGPAGPTGYTGPAGTLTLLSITSGIIDDSNLSFGFSQEPKLINVNGAFYRKNYGWTWSGLTATLTVPPVGTGGEIFGII